MSLYKDIFPQRYCISLNDFVRMLALHASRILAVESITKTKMIASDKETQVIFWRGEGCSIDVTLFRRMYDSGTEKVERKHLDITSA